MIVVAIEYPEKGKFNLTVKSKELLRKDDILFLKINDIKYYFKVGCISLDTKDYGITAKVFEFGYYNLISKDKNFDYRVLIGYILDFEKDEDILKKLIKENSYC